MDASTERRPPAPKRLVSSVIELVLRTRSIAMAHRTVGELYKCPSIRDTSHSRVILTLIPWCSSASSTSSYARSSGVNTPHFLSLPVAMSCAPQLGVPHRVLVRSQLHAD